MNLVSYSRAGEPGFGLSTDTGVIALAERTGCTSLRALLSADGLELARKFLEADPDFTHDEITLEPVIPDPGKIICVGLNYSDHVAETGRAQTDYPTLFVRFAASLVGHGGNLVKPAQSDKFDYEGELAVIIGKAGRHIAKDDAFDHAAGFSAFNDGSVRDWQGHTSQFTPGKNFVSTGGFGPALVTPDAVGALDTLRLRTRFNGEVVQEATLGQMINPIPDLIAYISTFTVLEPGDVIVTGTPGGVGMKRNPPLYMSAGDVVEVEIDRVGLLRNGVVAADR